MYRLVRKVHEEGLLIEGRLLLENLSTQKRPKSRNGGEVSNHYKQREQFVLFGKFVR